jgi:hypothetical protein
MAKGQQKKPSAKKPKQEKSGAPKSAYAQGLQSSTAAAPFGKKK